MEVTITNAILLSEHKDEESQIALLREFNSLLTLATLATDEKSLKHLINQRMGRTQSKNFIEVYVGGAMVIEQLIKVAGRPTTQEVIRVKY